MILGVIFTIIVIVFTWTIKKNRVRIVNTVLLGFILLSLFAGLGYKQQLDTIKIKSTALVYDIAYAGDNIEECLDLKLVDMANCIVDKYFDLSYKLLYFYEDVLSDKNTNER